MTGSSTMARLDVSCTDQTKKRHTEYQVRCIRW